LTKKLGDLIGVRSTLFKLKLSLEWAQMQAKQTGKKPLELIKCQIYYGCKSNSE
jgi:heterodisulfide reductase subunit B